MSATTASPLLNPTGDGAPQPPRPVPYSHLPNAMHFTCHTLLTTHKPSAASPWHVGVNSFTRALSIAAISTSSALDPHANRRVLILPACPFYFWNSIFFGCLVATRHSAASAKRLIVSDAARHGDHVIPEPTHISRAIIVQGHCKRNSANLLPEPRCMTYPLTVLRVLASIKDGPGSSLYNQEGLVAIDYVQGKSAWSIK